MSEEAGSSRIWAIDGAGTAGVGALTVSQNWSLDGWACQLSPNFGQLTAVLLVGERIHFQATPWYQTMSPTSYLVYGFQSPLLPSETPLFGRTLGRGVGSTSDAGLEATPKSFTFTTGFFLGLSALARSTATLSTTTFSPVDRLSTTATSGGQWAEGDFSPTSSHRPETAPWWGSCAS